MRSLSGMDEAVCEQGGVMQCFTGDAIMAVFGTRSHSKTRRVSRGGHDVAGD
jgi:class 3 adenylate cyclase